MDDSNKTATNLQELGGTVGGLIAVTWKPDFNNCLFIRDGTVRSNMKKLLITHSHKGWWMNPKLCLLIGCSPSPGIAWVQIIVVPKIKGWWMRDERRNLLASRAFSSLPTTRDIIGLEMAIPVKARKSSTRFQSSLRRQVSLFATMTAAAK